MLFLAVGLVWAGTALAINVPDGDFDDHAVPDGGWRYVKDIDSAWIATYYSGNPWIGNNYANSGGYPVMGHTGAQYVDLNAGYIHQALPGETYVEGTTYELSVWITTTTEGQGLYGYFLDGAGPGDFYQTTVLSEGYYDVAVEQDVSTWSQYTFDYTATADDAGKTIGIGIYGRSVTYADTVTLTSGWPRITLHPLDIVVDETRTAVFTVEHVNGTSYEWHKVGTGVVESGTTASRETITLSISGVTQADEGRYYCKVINDKVPGGVDSAQAQLTVTALTCGDWGRLRSDINRDCYVDLLDLVELAAKWLNGPSQ